MSEPLQHPPEVRAALRQQIKRRNSFRSRHAEHAQQHPQQKQAGSIGGKNGSLKSKKKAGQKGGLMRQINVYRKANMMNHPNAIELLRRIEALN